LRRKILLEILARCIHVCREFPVRPVSGLLVAGKRARPAMGVKSRQRTPVAVSATQATTISPQSGSGMPITAASRIAGCVAKTASTSSG
jgi:hypothetical protein